MDFAGVQQSYTIFGAVSGADDLVAVLLLQRLIGTTCSAGICCSKSRGCPSPHLPPHSKRKHCHLVISPRHSPEDGVGLLHSLQSP